MRTSLATFFLAVLLFIGSVTSHREPPQPIDDCPTGCICHDIGCSREKSKVYCKDVEVICANANLTKRLEIIPANATRLSITGENMGKNTLDIFDTFTRLQKLNLASNVVRRLDITKPMKYLDYLNLNGNKLCFLPRRNMTILMPKLQMLKVQSNNLTFIHGIRFPTRLVDLDLSSNHIQTPRKGSFRRLTKLQFLRLQNNSITAINPLAFRHLVNLESLFLDHNQITELGPNSFKLLPSLSLLSLKHNLIQLVDPTAFKQMGVRWHGLHEIRMEYNKIRVLDRDSIAILYARRNIYALYLVGNPIFCDCKLLSIRDDFGSMLRDAAAATCDTPPAANGIIIARLIMDGCDYDDDFYYDD